MTANDKLHANLKREFHKYLSTLMVRLDEESVAHQLATVAVREFQSFLIVGALQEFDKRHGKK